MVRTSRPTRVKSNVTPLTDEEIAEAARRVQLEWPKAGITVGGCNYADLIKGLQEGDGGDGGNAGGHGSIIDFLPAFSGIIKERLGPELSDTATWIMLKHLLDVRFGDR